MYDAIEDPYTYKNSTVLVNKLDLRSHEPSFALLADHAGHPLKIEKLNPDEMLVAMIASFDGDERRLADVIHGLIE